MRAIASLVVLLAAAFHAYANPALHGTWSAAEVEGRPLVVTFDTSGGGKINGQAMRWQTLGPLLAIEQNGEVAGYSFEVQGDKLLVSGGDLDGIVTLTRGTAAAEAAQARQPKQAATQSAKASSSNGQELVGTWCKMSTTTTNTGGSSRMGCFELRPDGTYTYNYQGSMSANTSGMSGGTASQSSDAGRWTVSGNQITAQSQRGTVNTYTLEKRNHPKNKRDPMICLDGECYVTYYNKPAW